MAKKRKNKTKSKQAKNTKNNHSTKGKKKNESKPLRTTPEGFWRQVGAIVLLLTSILMLFGSFGGGGSLSVNLFEWGQWMLGNIAYILPLMLFVASVIKIRGEDHKIPRPIFWGFIILFFAAAGFAHLFIEEGKSLEAADAGTGGGFVGHIANSIIVGPLSRITGGIVLFFVSVIALHFVFRLPLTYLFKFLKLSKKDSTGTDAASTEKDTTIEDKTPTPVFKLNEGVPVQRTKISAKDTMQKSESDSQEALTTITDTNWNFPPLDLLNKKQDTADAGDIQKNADIIKDTLGEFNINVAMQGANVGPRVTQFTLTPPSGVKLSKITALEGNLSLNLAAEAIRMEAPIPGKRAVGIEVPNKKPATVRLHSILTSKEWTNNKSPLCFVLGKDIGGSPIVKDLDPMPHLLIAGTTGTGKSVMINSFLISLLYRNSPSDLKLILVDPKKVELSSYRDIPHLITPVITETDKCISALKWAINEMEKRYRYLDDAGKRNIQTYNAAKKEEGMPYIVIVIDELQDLMTAASRDMDNLIARLAAKARAVGIHLVLATQRPSVNIITGTIKANVPARIAFKTVSNVDSRTILDQGGSEKLLSLGDMLYKSHNTPNLIRVQGAMVDDAEVEAVTDFVRMERAPQYDDEVVSQPVTIGGKTISSGGGDEDDNLYEEAIRTVVDSGKASTSLLQRKLRIGYSRASRLIDSMEEQGIVSQADGSRPREVLISSAEQALSRGSDDSYDEPEPYEENFE